MDKEEEGRKQTAGMEWNGRKIGGGGGGEVEVLFLLYLLHHLIPSYCTVLSVYRRKKSLFLLLPPFRTHLHRPIIPLGVTIWEVEEEGACSV